MSKYVVEFSKTGLISYISHLDLLRLFQRGFKRSGIKIAYSKGFNPHTKISFAQPLSLGYWATNELVDFETTEEYETDYIADRLKAVMPEGIEILSCRERNSSKKTLAACTEAAEYSIEIPADGLSKMNLKEMEASYMGQDQIIVTKKNKKKQLVEIDIKDKIRNLYFENNNETLSIIALIDSGSTSNLSPEHIITSICQHFDIKCERNEIQVTRNRIYYGEESIYG